MTGPTSSGGEGAPLLRSKAASRATSAYASVTPRDEYNGAYLSFLLLGAGFLFPWNAVITAVRRCMRLCRFVGACCVPLRAVVVRASS